MKITKETTKIFYRNALRKTAEHYDSKEIVNDVKVNQCVTHNVYKRVGDKTLRSYSEYHLKLVYIKIITD